MVIPSWAEQAESLSLNMFVDTNKDFTELWRLLLLLLLNEPKSVIESTWILFWKKTSLFVAVETLSMPSWSQHKLLIDVRHWFVIYGLICSAEDGGMEGRRDDRDWAAFNSKKDSASQYWILWYNIQFRFQLSDSIVSSEVSLKKVWWLLAVSHTNSCCRQDDWSKLTVQRWNVVVDLSEVQQKHTHTHTHLLLKLTSVTKNTIWSVVKASDWFFFWEILLPTKVIYLLFWSHFMIYTYKKVFMPQWDFTLFFPLYHLQYDC